MDGDEVVVQGSWHSILHPANQPIIWKNGEDPNINFQLIQWSSNAVLKFKIDRFIYQK